MFSMKPRVIHWRAIADPGRRRELTSDVVRSCQMQNVIDSRHGHSRHSDGRDVMSERGRVLSV